jgi:hypothetical protein
MLVEEATRAALGGQTALASESVVAKGIDEPEGTVW